MTALLIVDVQQALVDEGPEDCAGVLERIKTQLEAARASGTAVIHVQHAGPKGDELEPGLPGWQLHPIVKPVGEEPVFAKSFNSAFNQTGLEAHLRSRSIDQLVVCGLQTEYCIDATIKSAKERGFELIVAEGSHSTFSNGELTATQLRDFYQNRIWKGRYAAVQPLETVLRTLGASSD